MPIRFFILSVFFLAIFVHSSAFGNEKPLVFMVLPVESPVAVYEGFLPLSRHLEKSLNRKIRLIVAKNAEAALESMRRQEADFLYVCSVFYVIAHDKYGYMPVARSLEDGKREERGVIVVRENSDIRELSDLNGRTLALGSRYCATSNLLPRLMIKQAGLKEEDLFVIDVTGHNKRAILSVLSGFHDAAGVSESAAEAYKGKGLRYLVVSPPSPNFVFALKPSLPSVLKNRIKGILTGMSRRSEDDSRILDSIGKGFTGFEPVDDRQYNSVRDLVKKVKIHWREE